MMNILFLALALLIFVPLPAAGAPDRHPEH